MEHRLCETPTFSVFITQSVTQILDILEQCATVDKATLVPERPGFKSQLQHLELCDLKYVVNVCQSQFPHL